MDKRLNQQTTRLTVIYATSELHVNIFAYSVLGLEQWQSLMNADKSENGAQDPYVYFTDPRLYSNGFRIRTSKGNTTT